MLRNLKKFINWFYGTKFNTEKPKKAERRNHEPSGGPDRHIVMRGGGGYGGANGAGGCGGSGAVGGAGGGGVGGTVYIYRKTKGE